MTKSIMRALAIACCGIALPALPQVGTTASAATSRPATPVATSEIINQAHGLCLDAVASDDGNSGDKIQLWHCNGTPNQVWVLQSNGTITNSAHGLCLDAVSSGDGTNGDLVQLWRCNGGSNQQWQLAASLGVNTYINNGAVFPMVLDAVASGDGNSGDPVQIWNEVQTAGTDAIWVMF